MNAFDYKYVILLEADADEEWKNVYIKQDLTKSQRDLGKKHEETQKSLHK